MSAKKKNFSKTKSGRNGLVDLDSRLLVATVQLAFKSRVDAGMSEFTRYELSGKELVVPQEKVAFLPL